MFQKFIKIKNFRSLVDVKLNFKEGINILSGENASGKSSTILAIVLMKFNWLPYKLDECINTNTSLDYFEIEEEFEDKGNIFHQKYRYQKGKGTRELIINNDIENTYKNTDAVNKLKEYFDVDLLKPSMVYMQKDKCVIEISSSQRREFFKKIFNLNFKEQLLVLDSETKEYEEEYNKIDKEIYLLENYNYDYKEIIQVELNENKLKDLDSSKIELTEKLNKLTFEKNNLLEKNSEKEKIKKFISEKKNQVFDLDVKYKEIENNISKYETELYTDFEKDIKNYQIQLDSLNDLVVKDLENKLNNIKIFRIKKFDEEKLNNIVSEYYETQSSLNELTKNLNLLKSGKCPVCKKDFESDDILNWENLIKVKSNVLNNIINIKSELENEKKDFENKIKEFDESLNKKNLLAKQIELEKSKLESNKSNLLNKIENEKKLIDEKKQNIINSLKHFQESKNNNLHTKEILENEIVDLNESLNKLPDFSLYEIDEEIKDLTYKLSTIESQLDYINTNIILNKEYINHNKTLDEIKLKNNKVLKELTISKKEIVHKIEVNKKSKLIFQKEFPNYVITTLISGVKDNMNNFIKSVYKDMNINIVENKDKIDITYSDVNKDINLCSGFEKEITSLGYMYGLGKLQNNEMLILDEADASADENNSQVLHETLCDLDDCWKQIIVVTHRNNTKETLIEKGANIYEFNKGNCIKL